MKKFFYSVGIILLIIIGTLLLLGKVEMALGIILVLLPFFNIGSIIGVGVLFYFIGKKIGGDKARREINSELKKLNLENPHIYFRDIPNKYGIGVSISVLNISISKEDVLAAILDLCAKGYINFKQVDKGYEIIDNNKDRSGLLKNELYILDWVLNKNKTKINLKRWKTLCNEDSINLGLAVKDKELQYKSLFKMDVKYARDLLFVSYVFSIFLIRLFDGFIERGIGIIETLFLALFLTGPVWFIVFIVMIFIALIYEGMILNYNNKMNSRIVLSELGKNEYYELCSLAKFLEDFGRFAEKYVGEIIIWEQYLSYAIMFRLGKKVINTGYDKLRINENFIIDDLDKIIL